MTPFQETPRYLISSPPAHLRRPIARLQPVLAKAGKPNINLPKLEHLLTGTAALEPMIPIRSPEHWEQVLYGLDDSVDAILPVSIPAYPTEIWNSHPEPLVRRGVPFVFWSLIEHDEPDFWRYAARDFLQTLGAEVHLVKNNREGVALVKALAMRRFLRQSKIVVIGEQNFPWNARAAGDLVTKSLGLEIAIRPLADVRARYAHFSDAEVERVRATRLGNRYLEQGVRPDDLRQALRTYLAIREILEEDHAVGFGVNCFGDLIIRGGRDVPCLAQLLLREEGYIAACDGDYITMASMAMSSYFLDKPCMMSNLYPVAYEGAITDHFGDPLSPGEKYPKTDWPNLARLGHCGFVGVVSPEMTPEGKTSLHDWGGTYEIHRDGRGCGVDGNLAAGELITVMSLVFDAKRMMVTRGKVVESTRYAHMPHCEASALLELSNLPDFFEQVSRDHVVIFYGDHVRDFEILAGVLGVKCQVF